MKCLALLFTLLPLVASASDCDDVHGLLKDMLKNPTDQKGVPLDNGLFRAARSLNGAYQCLYETTDSDYTVECVWISRSYAQGAALFGQIDDILKQCAFIKSSKYSEDAAKGTQFDLFRLTADADPDGTMSLDLSHHPADSFANSQLGSREISLEVSHEKPPADE